MQAFPAWIVKTLGIAGKMFSREAPRFFNVFRGEDLARKVRFHDVLQPGNFRMVEEAAPRADVGVNEARVRRVLPPVRELVAVGI